MTYHHEDVEDLQKFLKNKNNDYGLTDEEAIELLGEVQDLLELGDWTIEGETSV